MKISNTKVNTFLECGYKYDLHYNQYVRPKKAKSALLFGNVLDASLNELLKSRNLEAAKAVFWNKWQDNTINHQLVHIPSSDLVQYTKNDLDEDLISEANKDKPNKEWFSLWAKGMLMLEAYYEQILPKIKKVILLQENLSLQNSTGDEIIGILDLVVEWENGKIYLMDNKSSSVKYAEDSAGTSEQLGLYYYVKKDDLKLDGVGYFVLDKNIKKLKKCKICDTMNEGKHKTCNEIKDKKRCNGDFILIPKCQVQIILNDAIKVDEDKIIDRYDKANEGIQNKEFERNYDSCFGKFGKCQYYNYCHYSVEDDLMKLEKK